MKLFFDHVLGKQTNEDFLFSLVCATFEEHEWNYAFETGWAPSRYWFTSKFADSIGLVWYQSRQTRLDLSKYKPSYKTKKQVSSSGVEVLISKELLHDIDEVYVLYTDYCRAKNFGDEILRSDFEKYFFKPNQYYLYFYFQERLQAITILSKWSNCLLSECFWWNYKSPELSLGKQSFYYETNLAKQLELPHLYTGLGYNGSSSYKADKKGFEFWTGRGWSSDTTIYKQLCTQDDEITDINSLHNYQYEYLKLLGV
jgi:hypothetical protein